MVIEAGYGLGEAVVSGQITPDNYVVEKNNLTILQKYISKQEKAIVGSKLSGNKWENVSESKQEQQKLSDDKIIELAKLVKMVEKHYGLPVDVEWAIEKNKIYILQSRPITTLDNVNKKI
jgi:pyruvate,water dikinase